MDSDKKHGNIILTISMISSFIATFMGSSVNVALPSIAVEFKMNAVVLSWVATSFLLAAAVFSVPSGRMADIYGRKKMITAGMIIFGVASIMTILAKTTPWLMAARVVQGIGGPMVFVASSVMLVEAFPRNKRGHVLGLSVTAVYFGMSTGPFLGGVITHNLGWRYIFILTLPLCLLVLFLVFWKLREREKTGKEGEKFDVSGSLIYAAAIIGLIYGLTKLPGKTGAVFVFSGMVFLAFFIMFELKSKMPVVNLGIFKNNRIFGYSNLAAMIHYSSTFGIVFFMSLYLQYIKGYTPQHAGTIIMIQPVMMAVFSSTAGKLSDRVNPGIIASIGMGITALGLMALTTLSGSTPVWMIAVILFMTGTGFALFSSPNTNAIMSSVEKSDYSIASGILGTMRLLGQMTGLAIAAMLISFFMGKAEIVPGTFNLFIKTIRISFIVFSALCIAGIFASLARTGPGKKVR